MAEIELPPEDRRPEQRVDRLVRRDDAIALAGPDLEIRFPVSWARKLRPWHEGPGRNILCNADARRFNLVGITKMGPDLLLSYVGSDGSLRSERVSGAFVRHLPELLQAG